MPRAVVKGLSAFKAGCRRSKKGNLWRDYHGVTISVFQRPGDCYFRYSVAGPDTVRFSHVGYRTEDEALEALWAELNDD